jgi:hypothetical protein
MIRLGYEIGSGAPVDIPADRHMAISGQTQRSGKTTTLEALVHRASQGRSKSGSCAVAFVTKRAESSFRSARQVPPYFRDSADWQFVSSILEAMLGERMKFQRSWIIDACRDARGLADVRANIKRDLHGLRSQAYETWLATPKKERRKKAPPEWFRKPATGLNASVLTELEAYLDIVIPQIERLPYTKKLDLLPGLNVMDLSEYSTELQQLVIRSVLEWVYERERNTVVIIPEAWEFIPQNRRSPVLLAAEELIRKGAAAGNFVWLDSQDIAAVHKNVLRSVGVWILGVQRELNEVKRTLAYVQGGGSIRAEQVMGLGRGQFFAAWDQRVAKVYVQPFWIADTHAAAIARGEETVESAEKIWRERQRDSRRGGGNPGVEIDGAVDKSSAAPLAGGVQGGIPAPPQLLQIQERSNDEAEAEAETDETQAECDRDCLSSGAIAVSGPDRTSGGSGADSMRDRESEGDEMWKELYEKAQSQIHALEEDNANLRTTINTLNDRLAAIDGEIAPEADAEADRAETQQWVAVTVFSDADYELLIKRLLSDHRAIAALDAVRPEIRVSVSRPVVEMDDSTLKGRFARLAAEGFFKSPRPAGEVLKEAQRRGWMNQNNRSNHVAIPLSELTELGILTREEAGYQIAPGCKITEAKS